MNILMYIFRLQWIDHHSTFLTILIEKGNQIRQPENTFSWKRFHIQPYEYLLVFYEFSISRSSIFEPVSHRISYPSSSRVLSPRSMNPIGIRVTEASSDPTVGFRLISDRIGLYQSIWMFNTCILSVLFSKKVLLKPCLS